jgi:membrane-associated protease RseP (regulator of RpoE activity)
MRNSEITTAGGVAMMILVAASLAFGSNGWGDSSGGAYLGIEIADLSPEKAASLKLASNQGALIQGIDQDGPACHAGLKANDVIVAVDGKKVDSPMQLAEMMHSMPGGKVANLTVIRDGKQQDIRVTLGSRHQWMTPAPHPPVPSNSLVAGPAVAPMPPVAFPADVEVPVFVPSSSRRGLMVEALTPQLAEVFGVPRGQGVLVRNVQKGSTAANSGLKAGDVIVKINGEVIRDLADWRRSMNGLSGKAAFSVIRDKREQTVEMNLPTPVSKLGSDTEDWDGFAESMSELGDQMAELGPEMQRDSELATLNHDEIDRMQREIEKSVHKEMKRQAKEIDKQMKQVEPEIRKQTQEIHKQMEQMRPEIEKQMTEARKQMEQMGPEFQKQMEQLRHDLALHQDEMRRAIDQSMKDIGPQIQEQMKEMQKQMEEWKKTWPAPEQRPNEF